MGWLIAAAVLVAIGLTPVSLSLRYEDKGFFAWLLIWPFRIMLVPGKKKTAVKTAKRSGSASGQKQEQKKGGNLRAFLPYVENVLELLKELPGRLTFRKLELTLILTDPDPCDLALNYGRAWGVLGNLMPRLEAAICIRRRKLEVECDFAGDETKVYFYSDIVITVGRLLYMLIFHGVRIGRKYISIMNNERVECNHE